MEHAERPEGRCGVEHAERPEGRCGVFFWPCAIDLSALHIFKAKLQTFQVEGPKSSTCDFFS